MANPIRGEVPLTLADGREFTLVLDMEGLVQAEIAYGKPLPLLMADARLGFVAPVRAMLYGSLQAKHPEITLRDASDIYRTDEDRVADALEAAERAAYPDPNPDAAEDKDSENPPRPGKRSSRSGAKRGSKPKRSGGKPRAASS